MPKDYPSNFEGGDAEKLTLWDMADPNSAVHAAIDLYGPNAPTAAAHCALHAHFDGRESDYRFWCTVFRRLNDPVSAPQSVERPN